MTNGKRKNEKQECENEVVFGSFEELRVASGKTLEDYHRPYVDNVTFACEKCGSEMRRIEKVLDCWFESGSMPFAQYHYPFENKEKFEANFPGDFICEYVGQVRAWFYYLHAVSIALFGEESFKNVIVTGTIAGDDGKKMSKSLGNYTDPMVLVEEQSADALRYLLMSSPLMNGEDYALVNKDVTDIQRKLSTLWQSYGFFVMYANVDGWNPAKDIKRNGPSPNILDHWILSRLHETIGVVDENMAAYNLPDAVRPLQEFIDDLSNWYIRRSRKRFWKSEDDGDKNAAYETLHHVLMTFAQVIAPVTPFVAEEIYRNLGNGDSVHLSNFPVMEKSEIDSTLLLEMARTREVISEGLKVRAKNSLKVRQPLAALTMGGDGKALSPELEKIVLEEMNVKALVYDQKQKDMVAIDMAITPELKLEGQAREIIRMMQQGRKKAGFEVDDRISVTYVGFNDVFEAHGDLIAHEVLASELTKGESAIGDYADTAKVDGEDLTFTLTKNV